MTSKITTWARVLLGIIYALSGAVMLFRLVSPPPDMPEKLKLFMQGIMASGYLFPLIKGTEFICGLLLLLNVAPALMLVILAPISLNVFLVHALLTPGLQNLFVPLVIVTLHVLSALKYSKKYLALFVK